MARRGRRDAAPRQSAKTECALIARIRARNWGPSKQWPHRCASHAIYTLAAQLYHVIHKGDGAHRKVRASGAAIAPVNGGADGFRMLTRGLARAPSCDGELDDDDRRRTHIAGALVARRVDGAAGHAPRGRNMRRGPGDFAEVAESLVGGRGLALRCGRGRVRLLRARVRWRPELVSGGSVEVNERASQVSQRVLVAPAQLDRAPE